MEEQRYFLFLFIDDVLINETQILMIKIRGENSFFPMINNKKSGFIINQIFTKEKPKIKMMCEIRQNKNKYLIFVEDKLKLASKFSYWEMKYVRCEITNLRFVTRWLNQNVLTGEIISSKAADVVMSLVNKFADEKIILVSSLENNDIIHSKKIALSFSSNHLFFTNNTKIYAKIIQAFFNDMPFLDCVTQPFKEIENRYTLQSLQEFNFALIPRKLLKQLPNNNYELQKKQFLRPKNKFLFENEKDIIYNQEVKSFMALNTLKMMKNTIQKEKLFSLAGETRKEITQFYDKYSDQVFFEKSNLPSIIFVHSLNNEIQVINFKKIFLFFSKVQRTS